MRAHRGKVSDAWHPTGGEQARTKKKNKDFQIDDEALRELMKSFTFVSSKQLAKIFTKKNDNSFRAARSNKHGFDYYKDKNDNIFYNFPEVLNAMEHIKNDDR